MLVLAGLVRGMRSLSVLLSINFISGFVFRSSTKLEVFKFSSSPSVVPLNWNVACTRISSLTISHVEVIVTFNAGRKTATNAMEPEVGLAERCP